MGVSTTNIILFGYEISYEQFKEVGGFEEFDQDFRYKDSSRGDLVVIADGRSGKYAYIGYLIASSNDDRYDGRADFNKRIKFNESEFKDKKGLDLFLDDYNIDIKEEKPRFHVFSKYH